MGLGVYFSEDIARILRGINEGVAQLVAQRGLHDAADVAYVAGYQAALRTVATSFGLTPPDAGPEVRARVIENIKPETINLAEWIWEGEG